MTKIVELSISDDEFLLGQMLADTPDVRIELERIIPTGEAVIPFLWVRGTDLSAFEEAVAANREVAALDRLDRLDGWALYRIEWDNPTHSLLKGIDATGGAILEAERDDDWTFRLRFPNRHSLSQFYGYCRERDISIRIKRSFTLAEKGEVGRQFGLTQEQREALLLALRTGYFDTPSKTSLSALAVEFDISEQALSNRIRRGTKAVLEEALLA